MNSLVHADIFFIITSVAVVLITIVLLVALVFLVKIFRDVKHLTETARKETDLLVSKFRYIAGKAERESDEFLEDIKQFRQTIKAGVSLTSLTSLPKVVGFIGKFFGGKKKSKREDSEEDEA